jgi:hypothetical protein
MIFSRPCRDWITLVEPTRHYMLGYIQPSWRTDFANGVLTQALKAVPFKSKGCLPRLFSRPLTQAH